MDPIEVRQSVAEVPPCCGWSQVARVQMGLTVSAGIAHWEGAAREEVGLREIGVTSERVGEGWNIRTEH